MSRPRTTLFTLMSVDGKISTGNSGGRDFDKDLPLIPGVREGLSQYYTLEEKTDMTSLNTGKVLAKIGWNEPKDKIEKIPVDFVVIDNQPHLTEKGIQNLLSRTKNLYIVTTKPDHPAANISDSRLSVIIYEETINFMELFKDLFGKGIKSLTIQSGGELNAEILRLGLVDTLSIVVAPMLVGGKYTPTLIDGKVLESSEDLKSIRALRLVAVDSLENSYIHLRYEILNQ